MKNVLFLFLFLCSSFVNADDDYRPEQLIIDEVECVGNESTDCDIIEREIYLHPGDHINEDEIQSAKIRLQLLALFRSVDVRLKKGSERGRVILVVEVEEDDPYFTEFNNDFNLGTSDYTTSFKLGNRNMFGRGKILQGSVTTGKHFDPFQFYSLNLEYIDPHLFGTKRNYFKTRLQHTVKECEESPGNFYCQKERTWGSFDIGRRIFDYSFIQVGVEEFKNQSLYRPLIFDENTSKFVPGELEDRGFQGGRYLLTYGWNSEDDPYFASHGSKFDLTYSQSRKGGYSFFFSNYKKNWSLSQKHILVGSMAARYDQFGGLGLNPGLQYVYQPRRFQSSKDVSDMRFFVGNEAYIGDYTTLSSLTNIKAGVLLNSEAFGIVQINLFARGN